MTTTFQTGWNVVGNASLMERGPRYQGSGSCFPLDVRYVTYQKRFDKSQRYLAAEEGKEWKATLSKYQYSHLVNAT